MLRSLSAKLRALRIPLLVMAAAVSGAAYFALRWYDSAETALIATYSHDRVVVPQAWRAGHKEASIELLTVRVDKVWARRIEIDRIVVDGVREVSGVTIWFPQQAGPVEPKWNIEKQKGRLVQTLQVTNLPVLLAGHTEFKVYIWGDFASYPHLAITIDAGNAQLEAGREEEFSPIVAFLARNVLWLILIVVGGILAAALMYVDKRSASATRS